MKHTSICDFEDENGDVDWKAYKKAKQNNGEECYKCGKSILFAKGHLDTCGQCEAIYDRSSLYHSKSVRCPKCRHVMDVYDSELFFLYEIENEEQVFCSMCDYAFTVETRVKYTFISPPLINELDEDREDED